MKNFYDILITDVNSLPAEIKEAYEKLASKFKPHLNQNDVYLENQFQQISEAYEVLGNPDKRLQYDQELKSIKSRSFSKTRKEQRYYNKAIDITFTLVLVFFTIVFGDYVIHSVSSSKVKKVKKATIVGVFTPHKAVFHKKKRRLKLNTAIYFPKVKTNVVRANPIIQNPVNEAIKVFEQEPEIYKATSIIVQKTENDLKKTDNAASNPTFPYATYINSNETGVINMRKFDSYGSAIIKVIPTKSEVFVLEKGNVYYKVQFDNSIGYVPKWSVQTK